MMQIDEKSERSDPPYGRFLCTHCMNNLVNFDKNDNAILTLISEIIVSSIVTATNLILLEKPTLSLRPKTLHLDGEAIFGTRGVQ